MIHFEKLKIWQKSVDLSYEIYKITQTFPSTEKFGLISQLRRASVSVSSNIAEGYGRNSNGEFKQFLGMARGSLYEVKTQIIIAEKLTMIDTSVSQEIQNKIETIAKMIHAFSQSLK